MTGAAIKGTTGPTATGGRNSGRPSEPDVAEQVLEPQRFPGATQVLE